MKIFVPNYRHTLPHINSEILAFMMAEIFREDLSKAIDHWSRLDKGIGTTNASDFFVTSVRDILRTTPPKSTLEPFLRRPHIVVHGGSKEGTEHSKDQLGDLAERTGKLVASNGFSLWYGGGSKGLMGRIIKGFADEVKKSDGRDDQYSLQIVPSEFVFGVKSATGMKASNEGLCESTDAAIIMPDFVTRLELLSSRCAAAITCPGGSGTLNEWSHILVHNKTGLRDIPLYTLNPLMKKSQKGYYDFLLAHMESTVEHGQESSLALDFITKGVRKTPEKIFEDLMLRLEQGHATPDQVYAEYCQDNHVKPGIPKQRKPSARGNKYALTNS